MLAGPSEVLVIADDTADVETVAADLLAQVGCRSAFGVAAMFASNS